MWVEFRVRFKCNFYHSFIFVSFLRLLKPSVPISNFISLSPSSHPSIPHPYLKIPIYTFFFFFPPHKLILTASSSHPQIWRLYIVLNYLELWFRFRCCWVDFERRVDDWLMIETIIPIAQPTHQLIAIWFRTPQPIGISSTLTHQDHCRLSF